MCDGSCSNIGRNPPVLVRTSSDADQFPNMRGAGVSMLPVEVDVKISQWLINKISQERVAVVQQLEAQFGRYIDEHHKLLLEQVEEHCRGQFLKRAKSPENVPALPRDLAKPEITRLIVAPVPFANGSACAMPAVGHTLTSVSESSHAPSTARESRPPSARSRQFAAIATRQRTSILSLAGKQLVEKAKTDEMMGEPLPEGIVIKGQKGRIYDTKRIRLLSAQFHYDGPRNRVTDIVFTGAFESVCMVAIILNSIIMCCEVQYLGMDVGHNLRYDGSFRESAREAWPHADSVFDVMAVCFNAFFVLELSLRVIAINIWRALFDRWLYLDFVLVGCGVLDIIDVSFIGLNPSMMRLVRLTRLMRLLKVAKTVKAFDSLFLLMKSLYASVDALFWSFILLFITMACVGMMLNQILYEYMNNANNPVAKRQEVFKYYGTFTKSMVTMYEITFTNWVPSCRTLMRNVSDWYGLVYCIYSCILCFAVVNVIRAVFITETQRVASSDDEVALMKRQRQNQAYLAKVHDLFTELDDDQDGRLSQEEFDQLTHDPVLRSFLSCLDLDFTELEHLFHLLDDGDHCVDLCEFVYGVSMLRGPAKSIDMVTLLRIVYRMECKLDAMFTKEFSETPKTILEAESSIHVPLRDLQHKALTATFP